MNDTIHRTKLREDVEILIVERIRSGQWRAGSRLPSETALAEQFLVSRSTIRSAVKSLQLSGILRSKNGSGTYVTDNASTALENRELACVLSHPTGAQQLVQARYILEPQLAALAAKNASVSETEELFSILSRMEQQQDRHALMTDGYLFHQKIAQISHNTVLFDFYRSIAAQLRGLRVLESLTLKTFLEGVEDHRAIACAIQNRNDGLAKQLMRVHLKKDYGSYLPQASLLE